MSLLEKDDSNNTLEIEAEPVPEVNKNLVVHDDITVAQENVEANLIVSKHDKEYDDRTIKKETKSLKNKVSKVKQLLMKKVHPREKNEKKQIVTHVENGEHGTKCSGGNNKACAKIDDRTNEEIEAANARQLYKLKLQSTQSTMNIESAGEMNTTKNEEENNVNIMGRKNYDIATLKTKEDIGMKESLYYVPDTIEEFEELDIETHSSLLNKCKVYFNYFGPGWIVAIAYLDPGNLCSNLNVGLIRSEDVQLEKDYTGYYLLWIMVYGHLLGFLFQVLSMKIGHITGLDLATICYKEFNRKFTYILYALVQIVVWGAHIQAIVGTFVALNLIFGISVKITVFYTLLEAVIYSFLENKSTKLLETVMSFLIGILACCFFINVFMTSVNTKELFISVIYPRIPKGKEIDALALLGSIISAHIFYLHTNLTAKKKISITNSKQIRKYTTLGTIESGGALFLSCLTNCFIVLTFAEVSIKGDDRREQYTLFNAYEVMKKSFGTVSMYIWSFGLLSSGNNSSFMCEYATKSVFEGFLNKRINTFVRVLLFRAFLFIFIYIFLLCNKYTIDQLTNFINVIQVLLLPLAIVPLYKFCVHRNVLGEEFALKSFSKYFVLLIIILIIASNLILTAINVLQKSMTPLTIILMSVFSVIYISFLLYLFILPIKNDYFRYIT